MKNIVLIGAGKRVINTIAPALLINKNYKINQIISNNPGKEIKLPHQNTYLSFLTNPLEKIKLNNTDILYIGIPPKEIIKVIKYLDQTQNLNKIILLIDTPPINIKNLFEISYFQRFKEVYVLEDWPFFKTFNILKEYINKNLIGDLKDIFLFHNSYKYHTLSLLRKLFNINSFTIILKKKQSGGFSKTYIFSGFKKICSIQDPRNYNVGRFILKGTKGSISDYEINSNNNFKNLILKYEIFNNILSGFSIYTKNKIYKNYPLKNKFIIKSNTINSEIHEYLKIDAVNEMLELISKNKYTNKYSLRSAIYDYIAYFCVDKFGLFIDVPIPFTNISILSILIKLILK